jgi:hypothetical protein
MRFSLVEWLERLAGNTKVATVLGGIPASSDTVECEGAVDEAVLNNVLKKKNSKNFPFDDLNGQMQCRIAPNYNCLFVLQ